MKTETGMTFAEVPAETEVKSFLERLKPLPEYRGPEYWYRYITALSEEGESGLVDFF
jgi:hypothetical protein